MLWWAWHSRGITELEDNWVKVPQSDTQRKRRVKKFPQPPNRTFKIVGQYDGLT